MKKCFALLLVLLSILCVAYADLTPPLAADGTSIVLNALMPYGEGLLIHHYSGEMIYLSDAEDNWQPYPIRWANAEVRDTALTARLNAMEDLDMDTTLAGNDFYIFAACGDELLALGRFTGALYRVRFEDDAAVLAYLTMLDVLPEKPNRSWLSITSVFMDEEQLYLLTSIKEAEAVADAVTSEVLYAFDRAEWSREVIPVDIPDSCYLSSAAPWSDGMILLDTNTRSGHDPSGLYVLDPDTGKMQTLKAHLGLFSMPDAGAIASDPSGIVILRALTDDLFYSVSAEKGVVPFARMQAISEKIVFHPDGRVLRMGSTYAVETDPLQEMPITKLNVLTGIHSAPNIGLNSSIPDIQLVTHERFGAEENEVDIFANAMTTQSGQFDIFLMPIMQAESIVRKGYCVPLVSETTQDFAAEMHPHMASQLTNEDGDLVLVPVQLLRRKTIAYDMRAAELLGIDPTDMPTTYAELFDFLRDFEADYGDLAIEHDISLFETSVARNIGTLRQRMVEGAIALSRVDRKALQANAAKIGALLDDSIKLAKEVSDVVAPWFSIPQIMSTSSYEVPAHQDEPAFLFTLNTSALPSDHAEDRALYRYLLYTQPFELALTEGISPTAIYSGYGMVVNPYSTKQEAALRYMNYVLANLDGVMAANLLTTAEPVESWFMESYTNRKALLERRLASGDTGDAALMEHLRTYVDFEPFLYDVPQTYLDTYQASLETTLPVWLDVKEAFAPCNAAWEQFLRGSISGEQLLRRVLEVSQMIEFE